MVHLAGMAQLVQKDIVYQVQGQQHQVKGEVDVPASRTTAPTTGAGIDLHAAISKAVGTGQHLQAKGQDFLGPTAHGFGHHAAQPSCNAGTVKSVSGG